MKATYLALIIIAMCGCRVVDRSEVVSEKSTYANQGEYENHLAEQHFSDNHETREYQKFNGNILKDSLNEYNIIYFDSLRVILSEESEAYRRIFTDNILNPHYLYTSQSMKICCFKELTHLNNSGTQRRFRFWVFEKRFENPLQYLLELTNSKATSQTPLSEFLDGAGMTHLSEPTVVI